MYIGKVVGNVVSTIKVSHLEGRTLLLVDGIRLNNSVFRDGPNQYLSTVDNL